MACRGSALYRGMIGYLRTGGGADPDPPGADPIRILPRSGHQWCLNYSWCGVRLDHRRREAGLSCIPGLTLVSLLDRVEGCYKCQPLRLEAISHTRDAHFRNIRGRSNNNNNNRSGETLRLIGTVLMIGILEYQMLNDSALNGSV